MRTIEYRLRQMLSEMLPVPEEAFVIALDENVVIKCGLDSLDAVELVMYTEDEFQIDIDDETADTIQTLQDAIDYLRGRGISDYEVRAYPAHRPVITLPAVIPVPEKEQSPYYVVLFDDMFEASGKSAKVFDNLIDTDEYVARLQSRDIAVQAYDLFPR